MGDAAANISRVTRGSCVGCGDQTQSLIGLARLPFLRALRFQTWYPVYLGFSRMPRTADSVHWPTAASRLVGSGGG